MRNPHNAAADTVESMSLGLVLYEVTTLDPDVDGRWIVRLVLKPGIESHPLADAVFIVRETAGDGVVVCESEQTSSTDATRRFCERMVRNLASAPPGGDDDW